MVKVPVIFEPKQIHHCNDYMTMTCVGSGNIRNTT
jgi:hypothetical protein